MFQFKSMAGFVALQLTTHCFFSPGRSSATSLTGTYWRSFDGLSPADESSASLVLVSARRCAVECQGHDGCYGFFYNRVSKMCVRVTSESDFLQNGCTDSNFRYYTNKYTCPVTTTTNLIHAASFSCFVVNDAQIKWEAARDLCNSTGGQLAVLDTRGKVVFIMDVMQNNAAYTNYRYNLGASRPMDKWNTAWPASGQDFVWLNGQPLDLAVADEYWLDDNPNSPNGNAPFIQLLDNARQWIDAADEDAGYICQYFLV